MYYKSQGYRPDQWVPGLKLGAVRRGQNLYLSLETDGAANSWSGRISFDFARHRRVLNYDQNYVRLNNFQSGISLMRTRCIGYCHRL